MDILESVLQRGSVHCRGYSILYSHMNYHILTTEASSEYELIDAGNGLKYERFGNITLVRPDPQALWKPALSESDWSKSDGIFTREGVSGIWKMNARVPSEWKINLGGMSFLVRPSSFKHVGVFPEHLSHWKWIHESISSRRPESVSVLNLFGYTGGSSLAAAKAGAEVCHVDASKSSVSAAKNNAELSGLKDAPIRWIVDDAIAFMKREIKRGKKYDAIIMDPPAFGRGPKGEVWKIEDAFSDLVTLSKDLLSDKPLFVLINGYAAGYSALGYANSLGAVFEHQVTIECGELTIRDRSGKLLPAGIFARILF